MSTVADPYFLDLDALEAPKLVRVKLDGVEHKLAEVTVENFVANVKMVQSLSLDGNLEKDLEMTKEILMRAFPTMKIEMLNQMRMDQLKALTDFAMKAGGQTMAETEVKKAAEDQGVVNPL